MLIVSKKEFTEAIYLSVYLSLCPSIHLSIHSLFIYLVMHSTSNTEHLLCAKASGGSAHIYTYMRYLSTPQNSWVRNVSLSQRQNLSLREVEVNVQGHTAAKA